MGDINLLTVLSFVGNILSSITKFLIKNISEIGINVTDLHSKILLIIILGIFLYLVLCVISIFKKPLKYGIIGLISFFIISLIISLFSN